MCSLCGLVRYLSACVVIGLNKLGGEGISTFPLDIVLSEVICLGSLSLLQWIFPTLDICFNIMLNQLGKAWAEKLPSGHSVSSAGDAVGPEACGRWWSSRHSSTENSSAEKAGEKGKC